MSPVAALIEGFKAVRANDVEKMVTRGILDSVVTEVCAIGRDRSVG